MSKVLQILVVVVTLIAGFFLGKLISPPKKPPDPSVIELEKATKQSKFNLAKEDFVEYLTLCQKSTAGFNSWKATLFAGYTVQYGIDAGDITIKMNPDDSDKKLFNLEIGVSKISVLSSEIKTIKAVTVDKALFRNEDKRISSSKDDLAARSKYLALQRLYGDPNNKIYGLVKESVAETVGNLAGALGIKVKNIKVTLPNTPNDWDKDLFKKMRYQCGNSAVPIFDNFKEEIIDASK